MPSLVTLEGADTSEPLPAYPRGRPRGLGPAQRRPDAIARGARAHPRRSHGLHAPPRGAGEEAALGHARGGELEYNDHGCARRLIESAAWRKRVPSHLETRFAWCNTGRLS